MRAPLIALFTALALLTVAAPASAEDGWYRVVNVVDGDTVDLDSGERLRLYGIDAPEMNTSCGPVARDTLAGMLVDQGRDWWIWVEGGPRATDQFGRSLGYAWVQDPGSGAWWLLDEWMIRFGTARAWTADGQYRSDLVALEAEARAAGAGCLWQGQARPAPAAPPPPPPPPPAANCHPSYPTVCIPPPPPDLDCPQITHRRFQVLPPDPHRFDSDRDGIGCES